MNSVEVTAPTGGRRCRLSKLARTVSLLEICDRACATLKLDPSAHRLKFGKKLLDLSLTLQFSGLPNNCRLELTPCVQRSTATLVNVCVSDETTRARVELQVSPTLNLWKVLSLAQSSLLDRFDADSGFWLQPRVLYLRREVGGVTELLSHSLRSLGIADGRVLLRVNFVPSTLTRADVASAVSEELARQEQLQVQIVEHHQSTSQPQQPQPQPQQQQQEQEQEQEQQQQQQQQQQQEQQQQQHQSEANSMMDTQDDASTTAPAPAPPATTTTATTISGPGPIEEEILTLSHAQRMARSEFATFDFPDATAITAPPAVQPAPASRLPANEYSSFDWPKPSPSPRIVYPTVDVPTPVSVTTGEFDDFEWPESSEVTAARNLAARALHQGPAQSAGSVVKGSRADIASKQRGQEGVDAEADAFLRDNAPALLREPCPRNAIQVSLSEFLQARRTALPASSSGAASATDEHVPSDFFEVTPKDLRVLHEKFVRDATETDEPLMTRALRRMQHLDKIEKYPLTVVRVTFHELDVCVIAHFRPLEPLSSLYTFVENVLHTRDIELSITPPRTVLPNNTTQSLYAAGLCPSAVVVCSTHAHSPTTTRKSIALDTVSGAQALTAAQAHLTPSHSECPPNHTHASQHHHQQHHSRQSTLSTVSGVDRKKPKWLKL